MKILLGLSEKEYHRINNEYSKINEWFKEIFNRIELSETKKFKERIELSGGWDIRYTLGGTPQPTVSKEEYINKSYIKISFGENSDGKFGVLYKTINVGGAGIGFYELNDFMNTFFK